jgi:tetratricopeptide (TPR) repeat protein
VKPTRNMLLVGLLALTSLLSAAVGAHPQAAEFDDIFVAATQAYDENRLPDAIQGWESLLHANQVLPEVLYNLGNARYRHGDLGQAIWAYRHAQRLAPRDPDIRANLNLAAQSAGITLPEFKPWSVVLLEFSRREWLVFGVICFWLLFGTAAAWIVWPRSRFITRPAAWVLLGLMLMAGAGLLQYRALSKRPECVMMTPGQNVLSSPLETATPLLALPVGSIVRQLGQRENWIEVQAEGARGWLTAASLAPIP